jgi:hypothetical protein
MAPLILDSVLNVDATGIAIGECPFTVVIWIFAIRNASERLLCSGEKEGVGGFSKHISNQRLIHNSNINA